MKKQLLKLTTLCMLLLTASTVCAKNFSNVSGNVKWTVGYETVGQLSDSFVGAISSTSYSVGSEMMVEVTKYFDTEMVRYTPENSYAGNVEGVMIEYRVKAASGVKFKPEKIEYAAVKVGSDGATYSWSYTIDGQESDITEIEPKANLLRNNGSNGVDNGGTAQLMHTETFSTEECETFTFRFYISKQASHKDICIGNVTISGTVNGEASYEPQYDPENTGEVLPSSPTISFADSNVKALCVQNWDKDGDGELSEAEAAAVKFLGDVFYGNTSITSFDELAYFTGLISIGRNAFSGCSGLASVVISDSVKQIGSFAFCGCSSLFKITIPSTVTKIGVTAFSGCNGLASVVIGDGVRSIGGNAFRGCSSLFKINIPSKVTSIGSYAFYGCSNMTTVEIGDGVKSIEENTFENCSSLLQITLPKTMASIGKRAFYGCSSLSSITIPEGISSIDEYTFYGCSSLKAISIPEGVTSIGSDAFRSCSKMNSVSIPRSLTRIESTAFEWCNNLKAVHITDLEAWCKISFAGGLSNPLYYAHNLFLNGEELRELVIPDGVTIINNSFNQCWSITSVTIPNHVTSIGEGAFSGCNAIKYLTLPDNLMMIKKNTFYGCTSLQSVTIPASVEYIYQEAFANCSGLQEVKVLATTPPFAFDNTFSNYSATLSVPETSISSYQATSPWSNFTALQTLSGEDPTIEKCEKPTIVVANGELTFGCATEGVEFHWSITNGTNSSGTGSKVSFMPKVSVYASKDGYQDSDTATLDISVSGGLKGDVNNNGGIDIGDAVTIVNFLVGKTASLSRGTGVTEDMKEPQ